MQIDLLYFDDCASWETALTILRQAMDELDQREEVKLIRVETDQEAEAAVAVDHEVFFIINGVDDLQTLGA